MELPSEVQVALAAFVAVLAANALKWASRFIANYVRGTPNTLDDKIWAAVQEALDQDYEEQVDAAALRWAAVQEAEAKANVREMVDPAGKE